MTEELERHFQIERAFIDAGWEIAGPLRYPIVGVSGDDLSITAHEQYAETDDPAFELVDSRRVMSYWVRVVPTPHVAAVLIENHGGPPEEERGNPYKEGV
jgi:hypothetical protein